MEHPRAILNDSFSPPPPVRTSSGPLLKVVGFQEPETSPASVLRFQQQDDAQTPSPLSAPQRSQLGEGLLQQRDTALPRLTINTRRGSALKKSKSVADLRPARERAQAIPAQAPPTQPSSPQYSRSQDSSGPVRIPFELSRRQTWACREHVAELEEFDYFKSPVISAASSLASHRAFSPSHRSLSTKELLAQADIITAQAQVQGLHSALKREHEEVIRLREELSAVTAERDRLLQELREASTPRVFDMDDAHALQVLRAPFGGLALR